jgi:hypothetical protein
MTRILPPRLLFGRIFFKSFDRVMVAEPEYEVWRLFRLRPGYRFTTHRPPTVVDPKNGMIMNDIKPLRGRQLADSGIYIYHYSYIYDEQVRAKIAYHTNYRLKEADFGIPPLPWGLGTIGPVLRAWRRLWKLDGLVEQRRRRDTDFYYDYFDRIWKSWDNDPEGIEDRYGVAPSLGPYRRTTPFNGSHPEAIARRIWREQT